MPLFLCPYRRRLVCCAITCRSVIVRTIALMESVTHRLAILRQSAVARGGATAMGHDLDVAYWVEPSFNEKTEKT